MIRPFGEVAVESVVLVDRNEDSRADFTRRLNSDLEPIGRALVSGPLDCERPHARICQQVVPRVLRSEVVSKRVPFVLCLHTEVQVSVEAERPQRRMLQNPKRPLRKITECLALGGIGRLYRESVVGNLEREPFRGEDRDFRVNNLDFGLSCFLVTNKAVAGEPKRLEYRRVKITQRDDGDPSISGCDVWPTMMCSTAYGLATKDTRVPSR